MEITKNSTASGIERVKFGPNLTPTGNGLLNFTETNLFLIKLDYLCIV